MDFEKLTFGENKGMTDIFNELYIVKFYQLLIKMINTEKPVVNIKGQSLCFNVMLGFKNT